MDGKDGWQGSGVVVAPGKVVTNCHVVIKAGRTPHSRLLVKYQGKALHAELLSSDIEYDSCLLGVPGLIAKSVVIANIDSLRIGQRVYAIGAPSGLELTLTDGLISSLRSYGRTHVIQTSTAISPGSSGGGLFDENGDLIGITSFGVGQGNGLNFAYRADRILSLIALANNLGDSKSYEHLSNSVNAGLSKPGSDKAVPSPKFPTTQERIDWLTEMSLRLKSQITDTEGRIDFLQTTYYESKRSGLDPQLVLGLIDVVSGFQKYKVSPNDARGYMQVSPKWLKLIGDSNQNLFHLRIN